MVGFVFNLRYLERIRSVQPISTTEPKRCVSVWPYEDMRNTHYRMESENVIHTVMKNDWL
jgi:hypothetical protein